MLSDLCCISKASLARNPLAQDRNKAGLCEYLIELSANSLGLVVLDSEVSAKRSKEDISEKHGSQVKYADCFI